MIPYWYFPTYSIGGLTLQTWGTFVALGILVAILIAQRRAKRAGISSAFVADVAFWVIVAGFFGARVGHVFFYDWNYYRTHLVDILKVWQGGFSSFGGFVGAGIVGWILIRRRKGELFAHADLLTSGMPLGWAIGRIGCFLIHDHPGTLTHFVLGVRYPNGVRHDLGLYDSLQTFALALALLFFRKQLARKPGASIAFMFIWYGTARFSLDFLRINDARYLALTPAQYGSVLLVALGIAIAIRKQRHVIPAQAGI